MTATLLSDRAVIEITGEAPRDFLQGLVTQDMARLDAGPPAAVFACLLTPQGKILFDFMVAPDITEDGTDGAILIDVWRAGRDGLIKRLTLYKLRAKIDVAPRDDLAVGLTSEPANGFADPRHAQLPRRLIAPAETFAKAETTANTTYDAMRVARGVPAWGHDFESDAHFLLDVNYDALNGVSYKKGCFIGQEVTSRMKRKADARRRTVIATFDDRAAAPARGTPVTAGDSAIGELLSDTIDGRALAVVRLDRWEKAQAGDAPIKANVTADGAPLRLTLPDYLAGA